jgi:hypothetical protein
MADQRYDDDRFHRSISLSVLLFKETKCVISNDTNNGNGDDYNDNDSGNGDGVSDKDKCDFNDLKESDDEKMRSHILDCLVALRRVQKQKEIGYIALVVLPPYLGFLP